MDERAAGLLTWRGRRACGCSSLGSSSSECGDIAGQWGGSALGPPAASRWEDRGRRFTSRDCGVMGTQVRGPCPLASPPAHPVRLAGPRVVGLRGRPWGVCPSPLSLALVGCGNVPRACGPMEGPASGPFGPATLLATLSVSPRVHRTHEREWGSENKRGGTAAPPQHRPCSEPPALPA